MSDIQEGQKVWVEQEGGGQRAGVFAGESEEPFGGMPRCYIVYGEGEGELVERMRVFPREDDEET